MKHRHPGPKVRYKTKKGKVKYRKRPKHKLTKENRSLFQPMDKKSYEVGGYMDFDHKGFERADVYVGRAASVDIDISPDKEIEYHTHPRLNWPRRRPLHAFPSKWDIFEFGVWPSQSLIIFHRDRAMVLDKLDNFKLDKEKVNRLYSKLVKDEQFYGTKELYKKYKPEFRKIGLDLRYIDKDKPIDLNIKVIE